MSALGEGGLMGLALDPASPTTSVEGPDGDLYVLTSNQDARGVPSDGDDRILRITPPAGSG